MNETKKSILKTPNKAQQQELSQTGGKGVSRLASQQETLSFHEGKELYKSKIDSQHNPNKTPKILSHPNNKQKQKSLGMLRSCKALFCVLCFSLMVLLL